MTPVPLPSCIVMSFSRSHGVPFAMRLVMMILASMGIEASVVMIRLLLWIRPSEPLSSPENLTDHEVKQLRKKKHLAPCFPASEPEDVFATSIYSDFELPAGAKPSWVSKLSHKLKKTFFLEAHVEKKLYEAHDNEKLARRRQIQIIRALQLEAASGSGETITPEEQWIYEHSSWTDDEVLVQPAASSDAIAHDENGSADGDDDDDESSSGDCEESDGSDEIY
ncbi:hypothetical protein D1007_21705 [Hordeum vulgare]|nr:hypothetical protein D1007_21705 [Hordeum vulgare]